MSRRLAFDVNRLRSRLHGRRGSALIITILIISVISTISFSVSALALSEFRKAAVLQDGIGAYYAAESGIEQGLMEYRLWHDAEISSELYRKVLNGETLSPNDSPMEANDKGTAQLYNLGGSGTLGFVPVGGQRSTSSYSMKMWYKTTAIGDVDASGNPTIAPMNSKARRIYRDSALNIVVNGASTGQIKWDSDLAAKNNPLHPFKYFMEVIVNDLDTGKIDRKIYDDQRAALFGGNLIDSLPAHASIRIKAWDMQYAIYSLLFKNESGGLVPFDGQISYIESNGSVGAAQRKLRIAVDRSSGTVLEASDFLLFSGNGPIEIR